MTCSNCIHHVQDWRMCLHPESRSQSFWRDVEDYACHTPTDVPEADHGSVIQFPIPAGATPGQQAPI